MDQLRDQLSEMRVQWIKNFQKPIKAKAVLTLGKWVPTQNSDALRHIVPQTLVRVLGKRCVHISTQRES